MLAVPACGAKKNESNPAPASGSPVPVVVVDQALADRVPAASDQRKTGHRRGHVLCPQRIPRHRRQDRHRVRCRPIQRGGRQARATTDWKSSKFDDIIPGLQSGKYQVGVSSLTINPEREKQVLMVSYFTAGTQWVAAKGPTVSPDDACGKKIAVQTGTVQVDDIAARSKKCVRRRQDRHHG